MRDAKWSNEIKRLIAAFGHACDGLKVAWGEAAFRLEILAACALLPAAIVLETHPVYRILLIGSVLLVLVVELLNTAVEKTIDRVSLELHPLSKAAKDLGSAAVLVSLVNAAAVWLLILFA